MNLHPPAGFSPLDWSKLTLEQKKEAIWAHPKNGRSKASQTPPTTRPPAPARIAPRPVIASDNLPPNDETAERAALGCVLLAGESTTEQESLLAQMRPSLFYSLRNREIYTAMVQIRMENHALDEITLRSFLKDKKLLEQCGGEQLLMSLGDDVPSMWNFPTYLAILREKALRRWTLAKQARLGELAKAEELTAEQLRAEFSEIFDQSEKLGASIRPRLKIWKADDILKHEIPAHLCLVGDNEISMGYDGVVVLAGPGSSGKSLCVASLALAGARGKGTWMGRKVHRRFKTLIIQAENGLTRLKKEVEAMTENNPGVDIHKHIFFSEPPEGGLPFHNSEFRTAVRRAVAELEPDLVVVDPWSQVATEDAAKEVVDKLAEIRSCFPSGDQCPGLLIVAHTKKPRAGEVHRGRSLTSLVSGSVALPNTARCVYVLLPWSEDPEDSRVYWCCPKLNNGEMYAASVWFRRFGAAFEPDEQSNPLDWGKESDDEGQKCSLADLKDAFGDQQHLTRAALTRRLMEKTACSQATAYRAVDKNGYLSQFMELTDEGWFKLKG